jgi:diaminopimelate decarboxylase
MSATATATSLPEHDLRMDGFRYREGRLHAEEVPIEAIAGAVGTPVYIYSTAAIRASFERLHSAFAPIGAHLHYAVKSSPNLHLCRLMHQLGAGMDVVSGGELERAWLAGTAMKDIVFAGVAKTEAEVRAALDGRFSPLAEAARRLGRDGVLGRGPVGLFNAESESELERIATISAELGIPARACIRVNPDVDALTHEYTTTGLQENKFGIYVDRVPALFDAYAGHPTLELAGLHVHIGSPVWKIEPYVETLEVISALLDRLEAAGHRPTVLDLGGGWAIDYRHGDSPKPEDYAARLMPLLADRVGRGLQVVLEPGRSIMANSGVLVTRVQHVKQGRQTRFVMCDAGMQTLIRPALYRAFHFIWPVEPAAGLLAPAWSERPDLPGLVECDVVGPICETGDFLARRRPLPEIAQGELLAVFSAGAYGVSMSSNYNDHGRPAEVLVDGGRATVIAERQPLAALLESELEPRRLELG